MYSYAFPAPWYAIPTFISLGSLVKQSQGMYQNSTPLVLTVPLCDVEVQALVYGDRTASGTAGGLAGEYAGRGFLRGAVSRKQLKNPAPVSLTRLHPSQSSTDLVRK